MKAAILAPGSVHKVGSTEELQALIEQAQKESIERHYRMLEEDRIRWREYCRAHPWPYGPDPGDRR